MPSILARKPCTKCCRACSPSVTMSTPASSCSFTASRVASRLARTSSSPDDFHGAHSLLGSASHSGFGSEPAIVVGNSMGVLPEVLGFGRYLPCPGRGVHGIGAPRNAKVGSANLHRPGEAHDRPALRAD